MYSKWLKIDLHIHTDKSRETKDNDYQGNFSISILHEKLTKNRVEIFSLTDHNIINTEAYSEYYDTYGEDDPLLLLGVELDIQGTIKTYHSLLIFNYNTKNKAIEISERLERKYADKGIVDKKQRILTIDEIVELFPEDDFFFIPHAGNTKSIVDGHRGNIEDAQKMVLLMQSAFEKVPEKARQKYNEGFDKVLIEAFRNKDDIAYIEFSDNHNIEQYPKKHKGGTDQQDHEFYYIKGSKNYETIRLAFIDPKSRIKSPEKYNEIDKIINKIEKIKIDNEPKIESTEIFFSPHLNVIIGGRSSGKSLLMNVLGKKIDKVAIETHYKITDNNFLIKAKDDDDYKIQTTVGDNLLYARQGDIVRYFEKNELKSLAKDSHKLENYNQARKEILSKKDELKNELEKLINNYGDLLEIGNQIKYELHKSIIDNIFSEEYVLKLDIDELKEKYINSEKISKTKHLINELDEKIKQFQSSELLDITEKENEIIKNFLSLIETKQKLIIYKEGNDTKKIKLFGKC